MKKYQSLILVFVITTISINSVEAQKSDYTVVNGFTEQYEQLNDSLMLASTVEEVEILKSRIKKLQSEYKKYAGLINNAIYPATFEDNMDKISFDAMMTEQRYLVIENQRERLSHLNTQLTSYRTELDHLNAYSDSLGKALNSSMESEDRLSRLVRNYRQSLEKRDKLVIEVIDSLLITYEGISDRQLSELTGKSESGSITTENPLDIIQTVIDDNIEFSSSNAKALTVEDHLRMYAVQHRFDQVWNRIGSQLMAVYGNQDQDNWKQSIDSRIREWRMITARNMWKSMDNYLEFSDMDLGAFDNNYSFFIALDEFVKKAQVDSNNGVISTKSYDEYKRFQRFWSDKIKNDWSNLVQDAEVLTVAQISTIDQQLENWEVESRPIHPMLLALFVLMGVSVLGFVLVMFKTKRT